jgi:hypothetical protein
MSAFLLDVWTDLRSKRLLGVALVLLVAILAVPIFLLKPAKQASPATAQASGSAAGPAAAALAEQVQVEPSKLSRFSSKNPFKPLGGGSSVGGAASGAPATAAGATAATGSASGGGSSGGGSSGGSSGGGSSGGGSSGGGSAPSPTPTPKTTPGAKYTYVADLTFGHGSHDKRYKGFKRLGVLPDESNPLLVFLGVTSDGGNAVFLVDSTLHSTGEGRCKPSGSECNFLYIGPGAEDTLTDSDGTVWTLRIDAIRQVKVHTAQASAARSARARHSHASAAAHTRTVSSTALVRRFVPPFLVDFETRDGVHRQ